MTITEWRSNEELVSWAAKLFRSANWKALKETMENSHVRHGQLRPLGPSEVDCSRQLGKIEGWDLYQNTLESAGTKDTPAVQLEATFEDPTKPYKESQ